MVDVTASAIANYEDALSLPRTDTICKMIRALKCDANYLYQDEISQRFLLKAEEVALIEKYRMLDKMGKTILEMTVNQEMSRCRYNDQDYFHRDDELIIPTITKPRFLFELSAGTGEYAFDNIPVKQVKIPQKYDTIDFVVGVSGDSMEPTYHDMDIVLIRKQPLPRVGEVGVFLIDGEAYIKELGENCLISHNRTYRPIVFNEYMRIDCMGKVVGRMSRQEFDALNQEQ